MIAAESVTAVDQKNATQIVANAGVHAFQVTRGQIAMKNATVASMARGAQKPVIAAMYTHVIALMGPASLAVPPVTRACSAARIVLMGPMGEIAWRNAPQHVKMVLATASMEAAAMDV